MFDLSALCSALLISIALLHSVSQRCDTALIGGKISMGRVGDNFG